MKCSNCLKLLSLFDQKPCLECKSNISDRLSVLCELCSNKKSKCAICLKNMSVQKSSPKQGCCGR